LLERPKCNARTRAIWRFWCGHDVIVGLATEASTTLNLAPPCVRLRV
jgi:hypothetical protein